MNDIVKVCKTHGNLTREQVIKKNKSASGLQLYRCKACLKIFHRNHYEKNRERLLQQAKDFTINNRELYLERKKIYSKTYREKHKDEERARIRRLDKRYRDSLDDKYIRKTLTRRSSLKAKVIPQEMVDTKKTIMKIRRKIKECQK